MLRVNKSNKLGVLLSRVFLLVPIFIYTSSLVYAKSSENDYDDYDNVAVFGGGVEACDFELSSQKIGTQNLLRELLSLSVEPEAPSSFISVGVPINKDPIDGGFDRWFMKKNNEDKEMLRQFEPVEGQIRIEHPDEHNRHGIGEEKIKEANKELRKEAGEQKPEIEIYAQAENVQHDEGAMFFGNDVENFSPILQSNRPGILPEGIIHELSGNGEKSAKQGNNPRKNSASSSGSRENRNGREQEAKTTRIELVDVKLQGPEGISLVVVNNSSSNVTEIVSSATKEGKITFEMLHKLSQEGCLVEVDIPNFDLLAKQLKEFIEQLKENLYLTKVSITLSKEFGNKKSIKRTIKPIKRLMVALEEHPCLSELVIHCDYKKIANEVKKEMVLMAKQLLITNSSLKKVVFEKWTEHSRETEKHMQDCWFLMKFNEFLSSHHFFLNNSECAVIKDYLMSAEGKNEYGRIIGLGQDLRTKDFKEICFSNCVHMMVKNHMRKLKESGRGRLKEFINLQRQRFHHLQLCSVDNAEKAFVAKMLCFIQLEMADRLREKRKDKKADLAVRHAATFAIIALRLYNDEVYNGIYGVNEIFRNEDQTQDDDEEIFYSGEQQTRYLTEFIRTFAKYLSASKKKRSEDHVIKDSFLEVMKIFSNDDISRWLFPCDEAHNRLLHLVEQTELKRRSSIGEMYNKCFSNRSSFVGLLLGLEPGQKLDCKHSIAAIDGVPLYSAEKMIQYLFHTVFMFTTEVFTKEVLRGIKSRHPCVQECIAGERSFDGVREFAKKTIREHSVKKYEMEQFNDLSITGTTEKTEIDDSVFMIHMARRGWKISKAQTNDDEEVYVAALKIFDGVSVREYKGFFRRHKVSFEVIKLESGSECPHENCWKMQVVFSPEEAAELDKVFLNTIDDVRSLKQRFKYLYKKEKYREALRVLKLIGIMKHEYKLFFNVLSDKNFLYYLWLLHLKLSSKNELLYRDVYNSL